MGPNPTTGILYAGQAMSVSCVSSTFCMVVGFSGNNAAAFADQWNGSLWSAVPVADPSGGTSAFSLDSVDCLSTTFCQAVGEGQGGPLNEEWSGMSWSVLPESASNLAWLNDISCSDASHCMAVGYTDTSTLASEDWDGSKWSSVSIPNEATGTDAQSLTSVSCPSVTSCVAVGWYGFSITPTTGGEAPIVDSWDGSSWSTDPVPIALVNGLSDTLNGVDCYDVGDCVAVGGSIAFAETTPVFVLSSENGTWSAVGNPPTDPNGGSNSSLLTVSCVSGWVCVTEGVAGTQTGNDVYFADTSDSSPNAPIPTITSPLSGTIYAQGQVVPTSFGCSEGIGGPGLSSCLDSSGSSSPGSLDTTKVGSNTYSVSATSTDGQSSTASIDYTVVDATITSPASGGFYSLNQSVPTSFTCSEGGAPGPWLCLDSNNSTGSSGFLDTSALGTQQYFVAAEIQGRLYDIRSISYTVLATPLPTARIAAPISGGTYALNQLVPTSFSCSEASGGPGLSSCLDANSSPSPGALDTATVGPHTYSVIATSADGLSSTATMTYTVAEPPAPPQHGYWLVGSDGGIFTFGNSAFFGSTGSIKLQRPVVGIVPTADRGGYWLDSSDGGVFSFGDTKFYGSIPGLGIHPAGSGLPNSLNAPIVGMVPSIDDAGYFMVGSDGGVFAFGDARFAGSCPSIGGCAGSAVAVMPDHSGSGYWVVTSTGHIYSFGDAPSLGAPGHGTVTSAVATPDGDGYWVVLGDGQVFGYGNAASLGSPSSDSFNGLDPATAIFATSDGQGYWVSSAQGKLFTFGDAPNDGDRSGTHLNGAIIAGSGY
jgi:hypothetical protein